MAKPEVIGKPRRGMLPPSGQGPIEVTRQYVQAEEDAAAVPAPSVDPFVRPLPSEDAPRKEIATAVSRAIYDAVVRYEKGARRLNDQLVREAGPAVRLAYGTKAFMEEVDPATGEPYRSFRKWVSDHGVSKSNAYRMINEVPVAEALAPVYTGQLPSGHLDVLAPVLRQHGDETLCRLWQTAAAGAKAARDGGRPTVNDLVKARQILGLDLRPEGTEPEVKGDPAKTFKSVQKALRVLADTDAVRLAMQHDPDAVRELMREVFGVTGELRELPAEQA